jgi:hypothetical protein
MRFGRIALLLLVTAPCVRCGAPTQPPAVVSVTLVPGTADMTVGASVSFTATVRDSVGNVLEGRQVFWASEDTSIVTVSDLGLVTAIRPGTTRIAASAEGRSDVATVTVQPTGGGDDDSGHGGREHRGDQDRDDHGDGNDGGGGDL